MARSIAFKNNAFPTTAQVTKGDFTPEKLRFAAVQGKQGKHVTWSIQMPFSTLAELFQADAEEIAVARSQRPVNAGRAKKLTSYITDNSDCYVLPSLTSTIEDDLPTNSQASAAEKRGVWFNAQDFETLPCNVSVEKSDVIGVLCVLEVPVTSRWWFIDGQHRATGIAGLKAMLAKSGIELDHVFGQETITIMCRKDTGIVDRQAHFSAINSNMVKPNASLNALYSRKDFQSGVVVAATIRECFDRTLIEYDKTACSGSNPRLFAYKTLIDASLLAAGTTLKSSMDKESGEYLRDFWETYLGFDALYMGSMKTASEIRVESTLSHSVMINALAKVANHFKAKGVKLGSLNRALNKIDFSRDAAHWIGLCLNEDGALIKKAANVNATAEFIINSIEISSTFKRVSKEVEVAPAKKLQAA